MPAIETKNLPEWQARQAADAAEAITLQQLQQKTYSELTTEEKDTLVRLLAEHSGMVKKAP